MSIKVPWGEISFNLDNEEFRESFFKARFYYFQYVRGECLERGEIGADDLLRLISIYDEETGEWYVDEGYTTEELFGLFLGYISGPIVARMPELDQPIEELEELKQSA